MKFLSLVILFLLIACGSRQFKPADKEAIRAVMAKQEAAWNSGNIAGYMEGYSDSICFISTQERNCGKELVTARYERRYPDREAMGQLDFAGLEVLAAGSDHAWCTGAWRLIRSQDTLSGGFSLLWERTADGWKILRDQSY
ncbi:MAG: DUF4440 domain-containing protein [Flavobacteriales bacterium]